MWVASFAQMCHPLCLPEDCDNACVSAHKKAPMWADDTHDCAGDRARVLVWCRMGPEFLYPCVERCL